LAASGRRCVRPWPNRFSSTVELCGDRSSALIWELARRKPLVEPSCWVLNLIHDCDENVRHFFSWILIITFVWAFLSTFHVPSCTYCFCFFF
jgi:hypothetical protein